MMNKKGGHLFEGQVLSSNDHTAPTIPALVLQKDAASQTTHHHLVINFHWRASAFLHSAHDHIR
jgi:hypothetical protein